MLIQTAAAEATAATEDYLEAVQSNQPEMVVMSLYNISQTKIAAENAAFAAWEATVAAQDAKEADLEGYEAEYALNCGP